MKDVIDILKQLSPLGDCLYRGHRDGGWDIVPSIGRYLTGSWNDASPHEGEAFHEFKRAAAALRPDITEDIELLCLMQHHGCSTRLLDVTSNPLAALFFASEPHPKGKDFETDGELIVFEDLPLEESSVPCVPLLFKVEGVFRYRPRHIASRIVGQRGEFIYFPKPNQPYTRDLIRITVPKERKTPILDQLFLLGVSHATIYPGLDGICRDLNNNLTRQLRFSEELSKFIDSQAQSAGGEGPDESHS